ncbi:TolC family protein [Pedobacter gandavensis]|uniref:TolC family protein n=1 Tax=Pedobacter gandavensis TaxID=2679963 RepID=A0ABR6ERP8_9SPHI|nr:TolC family protein [Pedobacter gandavensis]MBB2147938.1 TolC family protein [Pedobacter gandavensis]
MKKLPLIARESLSALRNQQRIILGTLLLTGTMMLPVQAQQQQSLSLPQALSLAAEHNKEVHKSRVQQEISEEEWKEKKEMRLPDVDFHASYARITDLTEYNHGLSDKVVTSTIPEWADVTSSARMPIYNGGQIKYSIKKAKQEEEISALKVQKTVNDIQIEVVATYLGVFKLMELQKLILENIKEEEDRLKEVRAFKAHGTVTGNEVLRAELQLSDMQLRLLSNKRNIAIGLHNLQTLLELPEEDVLTLDTNSLINNTLRLQPYPYYLQSGFQKEDMGIAKKQEAISQTEQRLAKSSYYPKLALFGSYGYNYPNYMFFPPNKNGYTLGKVGIEANFSLSNLYKNRSKVKLAEKRIEEEKANTEILKNQISNEVFKQYTKYQEIMDQLPVTEKAKKQATENYRIIKLKYLNQLALVTDMLDADNALLQAKYNVVSTQIDALMKHYELRYAAGQL